MTVSLDFVPPFWFIVKVPEILPTDVFIWSVQICPVQWNAEIPHNIAMEEFFFFNFILFLNFT